MQKSLPCILIPFFGRARLTRAQSVRGWDRGEKCVIAGLGGELHVNSVRGMRLLVVEDTWVTLEWNTREVASTEGKNRHHEKKKILSPHYIEKP